MHAHATIAYSRNAIALSPWWQRLIGLVLLIVIIGLLLPARAVVERDAVVDANNATVFALLNDPRQLEKWAPKAADDPNSRVIFSGPRRGVDASVRWDGQIAGRGTETITESVLDERVASTKILEDGTRIDSLIDLSSVDDGTHVQWSIRREYGLNIPTRYFGLFFEKSAGLKLEQDLARLNELATALPRADFSDLEVEQIAVDAVDIAYRRMTSVPIAASISEAMGDAYFEILNFIDEHGLQEAGAPLSITRAFSGSNLVFDAAIPVHGVNSANGQVAGPVKIGETYAGEVIRVKHLGPYVTLGQTHDKISAYLAALGIKRNGDAWESYASDPSRTSASDLLTYVYYPIIEE